MAVFNPDVPRYLTVPQFAKKHPAFPVGSLRDLIFYAPFNGLNDMEVIHRVGAKILIDEIKFFEWVATNPSSTGRIKGAKNGR